MKKIKKLVTLMLASVVVLAMAVPTLAADTATGTASDTGSITVNGLEEGVTVSAYQIAKAVYDDAYGGFIGYQMTTTGGWAIANDGTYTEPTESDLAGLWSQVSGSTASGTATADANGTAVIEGLAVGSYLIVVTGAESTVYSMMIGSVSYVTEGGEWATDSGSINTVADDNLWVKSASPTVDKEEVTDDGDSHADSASVGDEITFHITVENLPHYDGSYPEFDVHDVLNGLAINAEELAGITITAYTSDGMSRVLTAGTDYVVEEEDGGFVIHFVVNGSYTLNSYAGGKLIIEYKATVTEAAADASGVVDHNNKAVLNFSTNSYVADSENDPDDPNNNEDTDTSHEYSFSASLKKVGSDSENSDALAGASFALYDGNGDQVGDVVTSGENGYFTFSDLKEGTYTMKETKAPAGYVLDTTTYTVAISATYNEADGTIASWTITVSDESGVIGTANGTSMTNATIVNLKVAEGGLPSTGGRGTLIFTLIGCAIVLGAVGGVVASRKRRAA